MPIAQNVVADDNQTAFYDIDLKEKKTYYVEMEVQNGAYLKRHVTTSTILIDTSPPRRGSVKISTHWDEMNSFQKSTSQIVGQLAIANSFNDFICPSQKQFFPKQSTNRDSWKSLSSAFSERFTVLNRTGAFLGLGFNSELSDILKSGVISDKLGLNKGNYTVRLKDARGENMITTCALITDGVAIPYEINNKPSEMQYDVNDFDNVAGLVGSISNDTESDNTTIATTTSVTPITPKRTYGSNNTEEETSTNFESDDYGVGIHFLGYKIGQNIDFHCVFWARNKLTNIQRWFRLSFDPTEESHVYTINLKKNNLDLETTVDLTLLIDEEEIVNIGGFKFASDTRFAFATWNENDYKPPIDDIYNPFYTTAIFKEIMVPEEFHKPCLDGLGFYDGESGIKDIYLGISDNEKEAGNVSPMKLYQSFCFPCIEPCTNLCTETCTDTVLTKGFTLIPLLVDHLTLESTDIGDDCLNSTNEKTCNATAYYLNVRVVNFAGEEVLVNSNGIQIDVTPPDCEYVKCLDPDYSKDEPTDHIGSSSTIGAYWNCTEDISQINGYSVRILSKGGTVLMNRTSVGLHTKTNFTLKNGTFEDEKDYILEMTAVNVGGLSTVGTCSVHVNLYPPDVTRAVSNPLFTAGSGSRSEDSPLWTSVQSSVGIAWDGGSNDTEFYEWQIGIEEGGSEIFPPVKVGKDHAGSSSIEHGKLKFNNAHTNKSVGEFIDTRNMSAEAVANLSSSNDRETSFFNMEPGRCMYQSLSAIGYSHLKAKIKGRAVCIKRVDDVYVNASTSKSTTIRKSKLSTDWTTKPRDSNTQVSIRVSRCNELSHCVKSCSGSLASPSRLIRDDNILLIVKSGGLTFGSVTTQDKQTDYGSAATFDFQPFISDPIQTGHMTSRLLRKRIKKYCDLSFYIAPASHAEFDNIAINISIPSGCEKDKDFQPALIYWDSEGQEWKHIDEDCRDYLTAVDHDGTYVAEICAAIDKRSKRSTSLSTGSLTQPKDVELVRISRSFPNSAPEITIDFVSFTEDIPKEFVVETRDDENDTLSLEITKQPSHAHCNVTSNSTVNCTFDENFYGDDYITLRVTEYGLPFYEGLLAHEREIRISISGVPDPTERFFIDRDGRMHRSNIPSLKHIVKESANGTHEVYAGTILLADVDGDEIFNPQLRFNALGNATYDLKRVDISEIPLRKPIAMPSKYRTLTAYTVHFKISPELHGNMTLDFIAKTSQGVMTPSVTLNVYILENPCVYGHCNHVTYGKFACDDIERAKSFDKFYCSCDPGYEGQWCQIDTNECQEEPCALMFDCEDQINTYKCNINVPKLMAILICSLIALGGFFFVMYKLLRRYKNRKVTDSHVCLQSSDMVAKRKFVYHPSDYESRPVTSGSITIGDSDADLKSGTSGPEVWSNPSWTEPEKEVDMNVISALTAFTSTRLPPHHQSYKPSKFASEPRKKDTMVQQSTKLANILDEGTAHSSSIAKSADNAINNTDDGKIIGSPMAISKDAAESVDGSPGAPPSGPEGSASTLAVDDVGSKEIRVTSAASTRSMRSESSIIILDTGAKGMTDVDV